MYELFRFLPRDVQVALFSATLPPEVLDISKQFMRDPVRILVKAEVPAAPPVVTVILPP